MITKENTSLVVTDPEIQATLQQIQTIAVILTSEGNVNVAKISDTNITNLNTALTTLLDYYNTLVTTATTVAAP